MKRIISVCLLAMAILATGMSAEAKTKTRKKGSRQTVKTTKNATKKTSVNSVDGFKETASGLRYRVIKEGKGISPGPNDIVEVHYEGSLPDGTVFDSSYQRGEPIDFSVQGVIPGWTEALQLMKEGGKYELYIPYQLAYGERGAGPIPPKQDLIFIVELIKVMR